MVGNAQTSVPVASSKSRSPAMTAYMMERNLPLDSDSEEANTVEPVIRKMNYDAAQARQLARQVTAAEIENRQTASEIRKDPELARDNPDYRVREPIRVLKDTILAYMNHMREPVPDDKSFPHPVYVSRTGAPLVSGMVGERTRKEAHWRD